jgi:exonuclease-1
MGIPGLLPLLSPVSRRVPLSDFSGKRVAIDGFVWLHRASFSCAPDLVKDPSTDRILPYLNARVQRIIGCGIRPVVVFDGQSLPQKSATNAKRHHDRAEARANALSLEARGLQDESLHFFQRAVEITSETVLTWIGELKKFWIEYIVAPYEADAQLAYLARSGSVDCVLTEDGDLLAYQTPQALFKLDDQMTVICINYADALSHLQLSSEQFTAMCCLAGCDYIDHINRMGIQTALKLMRRAETWQRAIEILRLEKKFEVPDGYESQMECAMRTFVGQRVYDPVDRVLRTLSPIEDAPDFLGPELAPDLLALLVSGELDTSTLKRLRPEPPVGQFSPYFRKRASCSQPREPSRPLSPYFTKYKSKPTKQVQQETNVKLTSYFKLLPTT